MERQAVKNEKLAQLKDILAGTFAGAFSKLVEYPLDTIKVLIQVRPVSLNQESPNAFLTFRDALSEGGIRRIYRGLSVPLVGATGENLISFWFFGFAERKLKSYYKTKQLSIRQIGYCGAFAGIGCGLWLTPIEFIKCQMQVSSTAAKYNNSLIKCLKYNLVSNPRNLFTGLTACWVREIPGTFIYFVSYRATTRALQQLRGKFYSKRSGNSNDINNNTSHVGGDPSMWIVLTGGGVAGITFWSIMYPIDLIKSKQQSIDMFDYNKRQIEYNILKKSGNIKMNLTMQASNSARIYENEYIKQNSMWSLMTDRIKQYGFRSLYNGWSVTAVKSIIGNALIFGAYEYSRQFLDVVIQDDEIE